MNHRLPACLLAAAAFGYGAYSALATAYADILANQFNLHSSDVALRLAPGNANYWLRRADILDDGALSSTAALERAVTLDPYDANISLRLGLDAESRNDHSRAEQCFLEAARVSRLYQPRWTLANFYLRRGNSAEFWQWTRRALELAPADPTALFQLCWRVSQNADEILQKAIPNVPRVRRNYAEFLLTNNRLAAAVNLLATLTRAAPEDQPVLLNACDRFLESGLVQPAVNVWNALCVSRGQPCEPLQPRSGLSLTNGSFRVPASSRGFDWHVNTIEGATVTLAAETVTVNFSGKEPESSETIWQWIPVVPGRKYSVRFEYQTIDIAPLSGVRWQAVLKDGASVLGASPDLSAPSWKSETFRFRVPPGVDLMRLRLLYSRVTGTVRVNGSVLTRAVRLDLE